MILDCDQQATISLLRDGSLSYGPYDRGLNMMTRTSLRKVLASALAAAMLFYGTARFSQSSQSQANPPNKKGPAHPLIIPKPQAPNDIYQFYMDSAISYAQEQSPESQQKASELFTKAIELDKRKAVSFDTETLDQTTAKLYNRALQQELAKDVLKSLKTEEKKEKSWMSRNWPLVILGVGAAAAGVYFLTKKKNDTTPPPPIDVIISLDAYNSTKGFQKDLTARTVKAGSTIDIPITDLGVTGVDTKYVAVYSEDFKTKISFDTDSSATFTAPQNNAKYHIILFNKLGTNYAGQQVSYDWMQGSSLWNNKRNHIVYRRDFNGQTGPEKIWESVFYQLNAALDLGWVKLGSINRQPNGTSGDFSYGYGDSHGYLGYHAGSFITINHKQDSEELFMTGIGLEEAFENICGVDDIGGYSSRHTIQTNGVLNPVGEALFVFVNIKDDSGFTTTTNNTMANALDMVNVNQQLGPVEVGMSSGSLHTGFKNKSLGVRTSLRRNGRGFENYTTANFTGKSFQAGLGMLNSPNQQAYTAQATMNLDKIMLGASGGYDAKTKQGNVALSIGAPITRNTSIMLGVTGTPGMLGFNAQAMQALKGIGILSFRGIHTKNSLAGFTALGMDAQLDKTPIGPIRIISDYTKSGMYKTTSLGIGKPIGPGVLSFSMVDEKARSASYNVSYTASISF
jgi:hypothetical protein